MVFHHIQQQLMYNDSFLWMICTVYTQRCISRMLQQQQEGLCETAILFIYEIICFLYSDPHWYITLQVIKLWRYCQFYGFLFQPAAGTILSPIRKQTSNICCERKKVIYMHWIVKAYRQWNALRVSSDGKCNWGLDRFNLKRCRAIRLGDGGYVWRHGGNIPRRLSTINIFLICALLLTSKITSKWIAHY